jgi:tetratricopeptide (TPR) repeat protein
MVTVQILTKNNEKTIEKTLNSIEKIDSKIIIGDLGSSDDTLKICYDYDCEIVKLKWENDYSKARNSLIKDGFNFYIEPWEVLSSGHDLISQIDKSTYVYVINNGIVSKEIRLWEGLRFENPVYETIIDKDAKYNPQIIILSESGIDNSNEKTDLAKKWMNEKPTKSEPFYYLACSFLSKRMYKEFFSYANQYILMENKANASCVMTYYYMAQIELHTGKLQEAARHILTCISICPTLSEFWCLLGDIFYKQQNYEKAKSIYENALIIGKRRSQTDEYPIEIAKYEKYPKFMMNSIEEINEKISFVIQKQ